MTQPYTDQALTSLMLATYAKAAGLSREEATELAYILQPNALPSVDMAWMQLEAATLSIQRRRSSRLG